MAGQLHPTIKFYDVISYSTPNPIWTILVKEISCSRLVAIGKDYGWRLMSKYCGLGSGQVPQGYVVIIMNRHGLICCYKIIGSFCILWLLSTFTWWRHQIETFPRNWPFVQGIHRSSVNSPHKGQWRGALMFSLICVWVNDWVNNREASDLRRYRAHYDVIVVLDLELLHQPWYCRMIVVLPVK